MGVAVGRAAGVNVTSRRPAASASQRDVLLGDAVFSGGSDARSDKD